MLIAVVVVVANFTVATCFTPRSIRASGMGTNSFGHHHFDGGETGPHLFDAWLAPAVVLRAALYARHDRPGHHGDVRLDGDLGRPDLPLRSAQRRLRTTAGRAQRPALDAEPIHSAATSGAGSSMARGYRWRSASVPPRSDRHSASSSASPRAICSGWVDLVFQRITDILQALPLLVLALVMTAALGPSLPNVIIALRFR